MGVPGRSTGRASPDSPVPSRVSTTGSASSVSPTRACSWQRIPQRHHPEPTADLLERDDQGPAERRRLRDRSQRRRHRRGNRVRRELHQQRTALEGRQRLPDRDAGRNHHGALRHQQRGPRHQRVRDRRRKLPFPVRPNQEPCRGVARRSDRQPQRRDVGSARRRRAEGGVRHQRQRCHRGNLLQPARDPILRSGRHRCADQLRPDARSRSPATRRLQAVGRPS